MSDKAHLQVKENGEEQYLPGLPRQSIVMGEHSQRGQRKSIGGKQAYFLVNHFRKVETQPTGQQFLQLTWGLKTAGSQQPCQLSLGEGSSGARKPISLTCSCSRQFLCSVRSKLLDRDAILRREHWYHYFQSAESKVQNTKNNCVPAQDIM